jgi:hypothetical protein
MVRLGCGPTITPTITALSCWTPTVIILKQSAMRRRTQESMPRGEALPTEIQIVTAKTRNAAIELLARFFREEEFVTPPQHIAENFDRMIADPSCWSALAVDGEPRKPSSPSLPCATSNGVVSARSAISMSFPNIASEAWHVALLSTPKLGAVRKAVRRSQSPSRRQVSGDIASANSTLGSASRSPVE